MPCDMSLHVHGQIEEQTTSPQSHLEVIKAPRTLELTRKRKVACNPPVEPTCYLSVSLYVYILVTFVFHLHFRQLVLRIMGDFLLNSGVDIKE